MLVVSTGSEWSALGRAFVEAGWCKLAIERLADLDSLRRAFVSSLRETIPDGSGFDDDAYINRFHRFADPALINEARVRAIREVGGNEPMRRALYRCVARELTELIGPEIAMQRQINLVIQPPDDSANLLHLHTDAWAGCSPYEVIAWIPLVDVFGSKSMYLCPRSKGQRRLVEVEDGLPLESADDLLRHVEQDIEPVTLSYGEALLFSSTLLHGARVNTTEETRMVLNVRFKALFSPYGTKALGETFLPLTFLPASEVGLQYEATFGAVRG